jgi:dTDP-4-dehydrorhamnose reductase
VSGHFDTCHELRVIGHSAFDIQYSFLMFVSESQLPMNRPLGKSILVTGGQGQLGSEISLLASASIHNFTLIDVKDLDLCDEAAVRKYFAANEFHYVINCAAYTAVDLAEDNKDLSFKVNATAVEILAEICKQKHIRLIHISTDYVFDGESNQPMREDHKPAPLSVYGHSKLEGEQHALALKDSYVIRTAWVYSTFGKNFVKTISSLAKQRPELNVVADQIGTPTYARDLARAIFTIIDKIESGEKDEPGIYHFSNEGVISWYDFAQFIVQHYQLPCKINPIRTEEYKTKAARPKFSLLDKRKIRQTFGVQPPFWYDSLRECLEKLPLE